MTGWEITITAPDGVEMRWQDLSPDTVNHVMRNLSMIAMRPGRRINRFDQYLRIQQINAERKKPYRFNPDLLHDHNVETESCGPGCPVFESEESVVTHILRRGYSQNVPLCGAEFPFTGSTDPKRVNCEDCLNDMNAKVILTHYGWHDGTNRRWVCGKTPNDTEGVTPFRSHVDCPRCIRELEMNGEPRRES